MTCDAADTRMSVSGGSIHHHTVGQSVSLECRLEGLSTPPVSLYWERGNKVITANQRPGTVLDTEKLATVSRVTLHLARVELQDTGQSYKRELDLRCTLYTVYCTCVQATTPVSATPTPPPSSWWSPCQTPTLRAGRLSTPARTPTSHTV